MSSTVATSVKKQLNQLEGGNSYEKQYHQRIRYLGHIAAGNDRRTMLYIHVRGTEQGRLF
ncbi:hypothetical protein OUZ56_008514 [Daphnia magna]|uniref:Uncharacterized protein n=1 Tax=Daphnia magna TaxID=35525 RepID=A0ABR0ADL9_9CRUS|nr:hypothetical protein OUZ56_008514 [Daphnia magna]